MRQAIDRPRKLANFEVRMTSRFGAALPATFGPVSLLFRLGQPSRDNQQDHVKALCDHKGCSAHRQGQRNRPAKQQGRKYRDDCGGQHANNKKDKSHKLLLILLDHCKLKTPSALFRRTYHNATKQILPFQSLLSGYAETGPKAADRAPFRAHEDVGVVKVQSDADGQAEPSGSKAGTAIGMTPSACDTSDQNVPLVAFGVCTFRRPLLSRAIQSLAEQTQVAGYRFCIIVADNDEIPSARSLVGDARALSSVPLHYVHAPARNISIARNALLDKAMALDATFLAMIDDDEEATVGWAAALLSEIAACETDAVLGPVLARYRPAAPEWMTRAGLHDVRPVVQPNGKILTGFTGNVILRLNSPYLRHRRFELAYGQTGGEDDAFFRGMVKDGGTIGYASSAVAYEEVPHHRETLSFLMRRGFRAGQTHSQINKPDRAIGQILFFIKALCKTSALLGVAGVCLISPARRTRALIRASLHAGVCWQLVGGKVLELYRT